MSPKPLRACLEPGCPELIAAPQSRCPTHRFTADVAWRKRRKVYTSKRWQGVRRTVLKEFPICQAEGCTAPATDVHHILGLRDNGNPYDRANLEALCKRHHSKHTARETWSG